MLQGYELHMKDSIKKSKWKYLDEVKLVRKILNTPDFMVESTFPLYVEVAIEDAEENGDTYKLEEIYRLTPKLITQLPLEKRVTILESIIKSERLQRKTNVSNKLIESAGWLVNNLINNHREDVGVLVYVVETINATFIRLAPQGYSLVKIQYSTGKVVKVTHITLEDVKDELIMIDIVKDGGITVAI